MGHTSATPTVARIVMAGGRAPSKPAQTEPHPNTRGSPGEETAVRNDIDHVISDLDADLKRDWLDVAMVMVNNHLQAFRMLPWVMGGLGALLIVKYSGLVRGLFLSHDSHVT